jgi:hypothetical protein
MRVNPRRSRRCISVVGVGRERENVAGVPFRTGLTGAVVQRSLADWPVVLAAWLLLVCATTLLATGVVYGDAVASGGLDRALFAAPPATRALDVALSTNPAGIDALDHAIRSELRDAMASTGGEIVRIVRSGPFADSTLSPKAVHDLTLFESVDGIEQRATLVGGAWPTAGQDPLEATVSDVAARELHVAVGDRLSFVDRSNPGATVKVAIVGIWTVDPEDALWLGEPLDTTGISVGGTFTTRGPVVIREADLVAIGGGSNRMSVSWRGLPAIANLRVDGVDALRNGANNLSGRLRGLVPAETSPRVTTGLPALLDDVGRSVLVSRSGVILLTIQFAVLAGYAVVLVAGMLVERRRSEIALMRSRGASAAHLVVMAVIEAVILAVPAAALAPLLAVGVTALLGLVGPTAGLGLVDSAAIGQGAIVVSALAGLACVVALTLPTLFVSASPAGARAATGRQARTTLAQRLGLDLALVAVAGVALWQLRLYGAPLTRNARGSLGLDPLLVAAPAIGLVAGAVLALRVVPRLAELGEQVLVRGRGLVGSLGGRQLARRPLRYTRAALLLMLAAALGTLASAHAATWMRSQSDQASYTAAADIRATTSDYAPFATWVAGPLYRSIAGVREATPVSVAPFDLGRTVRDGSLVGLDPAAVARVVIPSPGTDRPDVATALAPIVGAGKPPATIALPGSPQRLRLTVDTQFTNLDVEGSQAEPVDPGVPGFSASLVVRDADGRLWRTPDVTGSFTAIGQHLVFDLADPAAAGLRPAAPLALEAIEVSIRPTDQVAIVGNADVQGFDVSGSATGDADWAPIDIDASAPGWRWDAISVDRTEQFTPTREHPNRMSVGNENAIFGGQGGGTTFRLLAEPPEGHPDPVIAVVASDAFMTQTGASVGDELGITSLGQPVRIRIVGTTSLFAPLDPAKPFLLADLTTVDLIRFAETGRTLQASQWWLRVDPGSEPAVLAALRKPTAGTASVIGRAELLDELSTNPVPLGLIGILGLGSLAAMLFAGIGFLVSSTISTSERIGEFALLRALGLSTRQLSLWLSIESVFLLVVGLFVGSALGLLLAWLVLPFATLTQTGLAPIPAPVVVVPWEALLPPYIAAIVLFVLSLWLVRRQLPDIRISGVLRARES